MKRFLIILVFLFFSCAAIKPGVYLNGFSNNCSRHEISGRGVAQLKGDFQEATNKARASATSDLLEANQDILVSIYSELRSDAVSMRNGERFAKEFTKKITSMAYSTILKEKRFQEKVVGDHLVSYVCIDTDTFVKELKETIKLRRKRFLTALDHYRAGMELDDPKKRLKWLDKAKQIGDATNFKLKDRVEVVISTFDSINHFNGLESVMNCFHSVYQSSNLLLYLLN